MSERDNPAARPKRRRLSSRGQSSRNARVFCTCNLICGGGAWASFNDQRAHRILQEQFRANNGRNAQRLLDQGPSDDSEADSGADQQLPGDEPDLPDGQGGDGEEDDEEEKDPESSEVHVWELLQEIHCFENEETRETDFWSLFWNAGEDEGDDEVSQEQLDVRSYLFGKVLNLLDSKVKRKGQWVQVTDNLVMWRRDMERAIPREYHGEIPRDYKQCLRIVNPLLLKGYRIPCVPWP